MSHADFCCLQKFYLWYTGKSLLLYGLRFWIYK